MSFLPLEPEGIFRNYWCTLLQDVQAWCGQEGQDKATSYPKEICRVESTLKVFKQKSQPRAIGKVEGHLNQISIYKNIQIFN